MHDHRVPRAALPRYLLAAVLVRLADEGARVALLLLALARTGDPALGGLLVAALLVPHVLAAPAVGLLTDRSARPRRVLATAALGFGTALAGAALALGVLPPVAVAAVLLLGGCCGPALTGGLSSQLRGLVPAPSLPRAFGADATSYNLAGIAGPALAAALAGLLGPAGAVVALGACAGLGALLLATLPLPASRAPERGRGPGLLAGAAALVRDPVLATTTATSSLAQLGAGALPVVAAVVTTRAGVPHAAGLVLTALAVGALLGSLAWTWRPARPGAAAAVVVLGLVASGLPLAAAAGATDRVALLVALVGLSGVGLGPSTGALFTVRRTRAPEDVQAQVFTLAAGLKVSVAAAGAALGGLLAGLPGPVLLLLLGGWPVVVGLGGLVALAVLRGRGGVRGRAAAAAAPSA